MRPWNSFPGESISNDIFKVAIVSRAAKLFKEDFFLRRKTLNYPDKKWVEPMKTT